MLARHCFSGLPILVFTVGLAALHPAVASPDFVVQPDDVAIEAGGRAIIQAQVHVSDRSPRGTVYLGAYQGESFLGRKWLIGKKIKKELDKPEGLSHAKMV